MVTSCTIFTFPTLCLTVVSIETRNTVYSLKDDVTIYFLSQIFQSSRVKYISLSNYHVWTLWHVPAEPQLSHLFCLLFVRFIIAQINPPNYCLYKYTNISWLLKVVCFKSSTKTYTENAFFYWYLMWHMSFVFNHMMSIRHTFNIITIE